MQDKVKKAIKSSPNNPGVYRFLNSKKEIIYIGKALNLKQRLKSYLNEEGYKNKNIHKEAIDLKYDLVSNEAESLILESILIKKYEPKFNVMLKDNSSYFFVEFTNDEFPKIYVKRQRNNPLSVYIGPFTSGQILKNLLSSLRKTIPFCTCLHNHKGECLNTKINLCQGYCCNKQTKSTKDQKLQYHKNVKKIKDILEGKIDKIKTNLKQEIKKLVIQEKFEKASLLRDQILALENIFEHKELVLNNIPNNFLALKEDDVMKSLKQIFHLKQKPFRIEMYDISNIQGDYATGSMIVFQNNRFDKNEYRKFKIRYTKETPNDIAMLKEILQRRAKQTWTIPDILLIDGGPAQLNIAKSVFDNLKKFHKTRLGSMAKGKENLFIKTINQHISFKDLPSETKLFLISLQDEAHRFAITYHHLVYKKRNLEGKTY